MFKIFTIDLRLPSRLSHMVTPRRLDRGPEGRVERPSLHDRPLIVEKRSLRSALRAPVETTESLCATARAFHPDRIVQMRRTRVKRTNFSRRVDLKHFLSPPPPIPPPPFTPHKPPPTPFSTR